MLPTSRTSTARYKRLGIRSFEQYCANLKLFTSACRSIDSSLKYFQEKNFTNTSSEVVAVVVVAVVTVAVAVASLLEADVVEAAAVVIVVAGAEAVVVAVVLHEAAVVLAAVVAEARVEEPRLLSSRE